MALDPDYSQNITSSYVLHRLPTWSNFI